MTENVIDSLGIVTRELPPEICETHGEFTPTAIRIGGGPERLTGCPKCAEERRAEEDRQQREAEAKERTRRRMQSAGVPPRFALAELDSYAPPNDSAARAHRACLAYAERWTECLEVGRGFSLVGRPGTGKTHLAMGVLKAVIRHGDHARYTTALDFCRHVKSTWGREASESESHVLGLYTSPALLVIDEIGVQFGSDAERNLLFGVIDERYRNMLPTVLVSNLTLPQMTEVLGERVMDRMRENGGFVLAFDWESYRGQAA